MFGSFNTGTDYTFTQSDPQNKIVNTLKGLSSYFGNVGVSKKSDVKEKTENIDSQPTKTPNNADSVDNIKKDSSSPEIKLLGHGQEEEVNDYLYNSDGKVSSITSSFDALAAAVGGVGGRVTKEQLIAYLQSLTSNPSVSAENITEITFLKGLIAQFDLLSDDSDYITSFAKVKEPQDYKTVTTEQVTLPIDIRV